MRSDEFGRDDPDPGDGSSVVPVGPVVPTGAPRGLPRTLVVAILVGTLAFVAGLQLGSVRSPDPTRPVASPSAAPSIALAISPSPVPPTGPSPSQIPITGPPYASEFAESFRPPELFRQFVAGTGCVSHNEQTQEAIGIAEYVLARTWTTFCPLEASSRVAFVKGLIVALSEEVPASHWSEVSDDVNSTLALFPYTQGGFVGTVTLSADAAGSGFEIVISLQERRAP